MYKCNCWAQKDIEAEHTCVFSTDADSLGADAFGVVMSCIISYNFRACLSNDYLSIVSIMNGIAVMVTAINVMKCNDNPTFTLVTAYGHKVLF